MFGDVQTFWPNWTRSNLSTLQHFENVWTSTPQNVWTSGAHPTPRSCAPHGRGSFTVPTYGECWNVSLGVSRVQPRHVQTFSCFDVPTFTVPTYDVRTFCKCLSGIAFNVQTFQKSLKGYTFKLLTFQLSSLRYVKTFRKTGHVQTFDVQTFVKVWTVRMFERLRKTPRKCYYRSNIVEMFERKISGIGMVTVATRGVHFWR